MTVRRALFLMHSWLGLALGLLIVVLGLSGSALVFRPEIEHWLTRSMRAVEPTSTRLALQQVVNVGAAAIPAKEVVRVALPHGARDAVEVILQKRKPRNLKDAQLESVFVDPYRGTVLGVRPRAQGWLWALQDFHFALFSGNPGLKVNGVGATALLLLALSGPLLWWPGWARRATALRVRRATWPAFWRDVHAVGGVISCLALALLAATAMYFAYRTPSLSVVRSNSAATGQARRLASADELVAAALATEPRALLDELRPSRRAGVAASVSYRLPGESVFGRHKIYLNEVDAGVVRIARHNDLTPGERLIDNMVPWHYGSFAGSVSQWLWFIAGLMPAMLFGSGWWLWLRKRPPRRVGQATT